MDVVVSQNKATAIYYNPYYGDTQTGSLILGKLHVTSVCDGRMRQPLHRARDMEF